MSNRCLLLILIFASVLGCGGSSDGDESSAGGTTGSGGSIGSSGGTTTTATSTIKDAGTVGATCTGDDESSPSFSGYFESETNLLSGDTECATDACLVIGFTGRKSCPEGQTDEEVAAGTGTCLTPEGEAVTVSVAAQTDPDSVDRHVFCSCRCDTGVDEPCVCPSDMQCTELVSASSLHEAMSFCVYPDSVQ